MGWADGQSGVLAISWILIFVLYRRPQEICVSWTRRGRRFITKVSREVFFFGGGGGGGEKGVNVELDWKSNGRKEKVRFRL